MDTIIQFCRSFFHTHTILAIAIVAGLIVCACIKPKAMLKMGIAGLVLGVIFYIISLLGGTMFTGASHKGELTNRSQEAMEFR